MAEAIQSDSPAPDARPGAIAAASFGERDLLFTAGLVAAVFLAYRPAWDGGFLWDDKAHVTRPDLRSLQGLWRIWFDLGATQQHYPLVHSAFWLQYRLWGDDPAGYHLVNLGLHCLVALMVALTLRQLAVPCYSTGGVVGLMVPNSP